MSLNELVEEYFGQTSSKDFPPPGGGKDVTQNPRTKDNPVSDRILTIQAEDELIARMDDYVKHHINIHTVAILNGWLAFIKTIMNNKKEA